MPGLVNPGKEWFESAGIEPYPVHYAELAIELVTELATELLSVRTAVPGFAAVG